MKRDKESDIVFQKDIDRLLDTDNDKEKTIKSKNENKSGKRDMLTDEEISELLKLIDDTELDE